MKETVMQFGEGGFLRGFVDYFFKKLNDAGVYEGKVVVIQICLTIRIANITCT
mgnify:CR=1 FL=1